MANSIEDTGHPTVPSVPDWVAVSIGIMTIATIIAVSTVAAAISIVREDFVRHSVGTAQGSAVTATLHIDESSTGVAIIAGAGAAVSIMAYYGVVMMGLSALFLQSAPERRQRVMSSAVLLTIQTGIVVVFALLAILGPLLSAAD